jgi:polysaccharide export outer membrane protein
LNPIDQTNLPAQKIGKEDLLGVSVYDSPELTHTYRVMADGHIRLPMLKTTIPAEGLMPSDVEVLIADELKREQLLVDPFVTVTVVDYHSRPINVSGAVRSPVIFQAVGTVHLLDAIARAGGLDSSAGGEIIITRPNGDGETQSIQHIPARALIGGADQSLNVKLTGGEEIRVPPVATIVVTGNIKTPGIYSVQESGTSSVMIAVAQAQGWGPGLYVPTKAYIYRSDGQGQRQEIEIDLKAIRKRKKPDVVLQAKDILYLPENPKAKNVDQAIQAATGLSVAAAAALIYTGINKP